MASRSILERLSTAEVKSLRLVARPPPKSSRSSRSSRARPAGLVHTAVPSSATAVAAPAIPAKRGPTIGAWATRLAAGRKTTPRSTAAAGGTNRRRVNARMLTQRASTTPVNPPFTIYILYATLAGLGRGPSQRDQVSRTGFAKRLALREPERSFGIRRPVEAASGRAGRRCAHQRADPEAQLRRRYVRVRPARRSRTATGAHCGNISESRETRNVCSRANWPERTECVTMSVKTIHVAPGANSVRSARADSWYE